MQHQKHVDFLKHHLTKLGCIPLDGAFHFVSKTGREHKVIINHTNAHWAIRLKVDDYWAVAVNGGPQEARAMVQAIREVKR